MFQLLAARRAVWSLLLITASSFAQIPHNQEETPGPALSPETAMAKMTLPPGFSVELFASEPDVINPIAMTFDNQGRVWVVESLEYPRLDAGEGKDRIKILQDSDGDGRADKVTLFAEGLNIPSGIALGFGGVFVANSPDLLFLKDKDGDGRADERKVLLTGFGRDDVHELPSGLTWGPDGWLYGLNGVFNRSKITHQGKTHEFTCALWRYHPKTEKFELFCEGTSNPYGLDYDAEGSFFVSACVIDHLWHLTETGYYHRQAGAYPPYTWKIRSIVSHKHQKAAYCGVCWLDTNSFPAEYAGKLLMGNIHGSCLNVDAIQRNGASYKASPGSDFVTAHDAWFMPVSQKLGPDGALWVLDWYDRYHCYQDARRDPNGIDRGAGRIYRIVYGDKSKEMPTDFDRMKDHDLVARLSHENVFHRRRARQLLVERQAEKISLESMANDGAIPQKTRLEAIWTRISQGELSNEFLSSLLKNKDPVIRSWGVRAVGDHAQIDNTLLSELTKLVDDPDPRVRLQVAIAAPKQLSATDACSTLLSLQLTAEDDPSELLPRIIWRNLERTIPSSLPSITTWIEHRQKEDALHPEFIARLIERLLDLPAVHHDELAKAFTAIFKQAEVDSNIRDVLYRSLFKAVETGPSQRELVAKIAKERLAAAPTTNESPSLLVARLGLAVLIGNPDAELQTMNLLRGKELPDTERLQLFEAWSLRKNADHEQLAAMAGPILDQLSSESLAKLWRIVTRFETPAVADIVLLRYDQLPIETHSQAIDLLVSRPMWRDKLLDAIEAKQIPKEEIGVHHLRQMATSKRESLRNRVEKIWGKVRLDDKGGRNQIVQRMRSALNASPGNAGAGEKVFGRVCAQCHRLGKVGHEVGPELSRNGTASLDNLTSNVFDPNLVVSDDYQPRQVITTDGRIVFGLIVEESDSRVILKIAGGERVILPREEIDVMQESAQSIMPEGLEQQITEQDFRDLVAYLRQQSNTSKN
ncbi:c-type cytochrome [bacterium]|nr:c-type cytochrome [bacterium]